VQPYRLGARFLVAALAVLTLAPAAVAAPVPAPTAVPAVDGDSPLAVQVTGAQPLAPAPGGTLSISGAVVNRSASAAEDVSVLLRVSPNPLLSRSEVADVVDQRTSRRGQPVPSTRISLAPALAPGGSAPFEIVAQVDDLPWQGNGVYSVFVQADADLGTAMTALPVPWFPQLQDVQPSSVVVLNPVLAPVDLTAAGALLTDSLPRSMASGQLGTFAAAGAAAAEAGVPVSWVLDPAVIEAARRLAVGTAQFANSGDAGALTQVRQWLETVESAISAPGASVRTTGYGEVDASAVLSQGLGELLDESLQRAQASDGATGTEGVITPLAPGTADPATTEGLVARGAGLVVLSQAVAPTERDVAFTPSGIGRWSLASGELTGVVVDDGLQQALARPSGTAAEQFTAAQAVLADLAMVTLELPTSPRTVVLQPPTGTAPAAQWYASLLTSIGGAGFIRPVGLQSLLATPVEVPRTLVPAADPAALPAAYLAPIPPLQDRLESFSAVVTGPLEFAPDFRRAMLRSASIQWRPQQPLGSALLTVIGEDLTTLEGKVTTVSSGTVTLSGNRGILPLTISNNLEQDVAVDVELLGDPAVRLNSISPGLTVVGAGKRSVVEIPVEVFGTGPLPVSVTLTDRTGRPFITTGDLELRATAANRIAAGFAAAGGAMLVGMVVWRFRRRGTRSEADAQP
jgi:hypothetical protein